MRYFIFDYERDSHLINSFLKSAALAHNHLKSKPYDWFTWKFKDNPFGKTILACAEDNKKIVGCVAYGMQPFRLRGKKIQGVLSFETFVHPTFQGKGVFKKLIQLGEEEAKGREVDLMINFPNANSLKGFLQTGWGQVEKSEYWIKGKSLATIPLSLRDLCKGFQPADSNLFELQIPESFNQNYESALSSTITIDYLEWRFFSQPVGGYKIIDDNHFYSILRMGKRGQLYEAQVLFVNRKNSDDFNMTEFLEVCKSQVNYDIISFPISKNNSIRKYLKKSLFVKVPNQTNICYKILNKDVVNAKEVEAISLSAINYHTY